MRIYTDLSVSRYLLFMMTAVFTFHGKVSEHRKATHDNGRKYNQDDETKHQVFLFAR